MTGLVLEGGGSKGSYQAGVYMAMYECGLKIDGVCGTSIGALNGAIIASGKGEELPKIWRSLSIGKIFGFSDKFIKTFNKGKISFNLIKMSISSIANILDTKGFDINGVREIIDEYVDIDAIYNSPIDLGICTIRAKDFEPLYLFKKDMSKDKFADYLLASSFLPIFKKEKLIDDNYYLDGGFYDLGPVNMLLDKGYDHIYLVKNKGLGIRRKYEETAKVTIIEPTRDLGRVIELNPEKINENIKMGYYDGIRVLKKLDGYKYVFKRKSEKFYQNLNRHVSLKEFHRLQTFFKTESYKETSIKAIEYLMEQKEINYYKIYKVNKILKNFQKDKENTNFIFNYVLKLKLWWQF